LIQILDNDCLSSCLQIYDDYCPILLKQFKSREYDEFVTFDAALDEFYSKIESQKVNQQQKAKEESAAQRLNKIKLDQVSLLTLKFCSAYLQSQF
jgi:predicted ribosome quality control (RQC) complex YloA/Tae2 family protein